MNLHPFFRFPLLSSLCLALVQCSSDPDPVIRASDGSTMLLIPAGEFTMGGREDDMAHDPELSGYLNYLAERPLHRVFISSFYMAKLEITNAQYHHFLDAVGIGGNADVNHPDQPADLDHVQHYLTEDLKGDDQPALGLNWFDAYAYCRWAGKRLPTEAEWEYAARGGDGVYRKYPWGNEPPDADGIWRASYHPPQGRDLDGHYVSSPVGSFPDGISPFGILDMAGNAEEWVQDWLQFDYYKETEGAQNPQGPAVGNRKVIKGGSYTVDENYIRIAIRLYGGPADPSPYLGVRCARDI